ncbi:MAG: hypothetical protein KC496_04725 [Anaerolineae bacterium]|nr:hypothetical protein [Anaerolineae bacterium]
MRSRVQISPAAVDHLRQLSEYWYDAIALRQQHQPLRLKPRARDHWEAAATTWVHDEAVLFSVALVDGSIRGAVAVGLVDNAPGLLPDQIGHLLDFTLDMHATDAAGGVGRELIRAAQTWLAAQGVETLRVHISQPSSVERAFWIALGAKQKGIVYCLQTG